MPLLKHGIFVEPGGALREYLLACKARVRGWRTGQKYCDHPPHATLVFGAYGEPAAWLDALAVAVRRPPFVLRVSGWEVFADDTFAGGGQTVALAVEASDALSALQLDVARVLGPHQQPVPAPLLAEPFATSQWIYGFPFVGAHWRAHFSVASLDVPRGHPFVTELTAEPVDFVQQVEGVSVWRVEGDAHARVAELSFPAFP